MCGRYALYADQALLEAVFEMAGVPDFGASYNIAPTDPILAVTAKEGARAAGLYRWGLVPFWAKEIGRFSTINARAETLADKPAFRTPFKRRRCLVPANGYYEWQQRPGGKQPYYIHAADGGLLAFAGLWDLWHAPGGEAVRSAAIVVTGANADTRAIHDRMPVILGRRDWDAWLDPGNEDTASLSALLQPAPADLLAAHPVSTAVNSPKNDTPACIRETGRTGGD